MKRRQAIAAGVVAAASAGIGWALHRYVGSAPDADVAEADGPVDVWQLRFQRPGGGELALAEFRGRPLLLNFWATWCPPCVEEMPLLDRFEREQGAAGWRVVGLAVDSAAPVNEFLARHPVAFAIGLAGIEGLKLSRSLGNTVGGLPFSAAFGSIGEVSAIKLGPLRGDELAAWSRRIS